MFCAFGDSVSWVEQTSKMFNNFVVYIPQLRGPEKC